MTDNEQEINRIRKVYNTIYRPDSRDRSYTWHPRNPISVFYRQAQERMIIDLFNVADINLENMVSLDVGCGTGGFLRFLSSLGSLPEHLNGIDLMSYRIQQAKCSSPEAIKYIIGNAETLPYNDQSFDLISQFTVFSSILNTDMRVNVAREIYRVLKGGGNILWYDMKTASTSTTRGIEADEIKRLFPNCSINYMTRCHSPYISRFAKRSHLLCEFIELLPGKKTHLLALLQKSTSMK